VNRFERIIALIDEANAEDPNRERHEQREWPKELLYSHRMSAWLEVLRPDAPETLRIAVRAQHIRRWVRPRSDYPMDREGYLKWRRDLQDFHAGTTAELMGRAGYSESHMERVRFLLRKRRINRDPDSATLEDCACLVFLTHHLRAFGERTESAKVVDILRKTWGKMSGQGRAEALKLDFPREVRPLIEAALGGGSA